jgi:CheY-like chemotaxis protein
MRILRDTLVAVLNLQDDMEVVTEVGEGVAIVPAALRYQPDVAVVDIDLPGVDGLTASADLRQHCPDCKILILTVLANPGSLRRALAVHVDGFLAKDTPAAPSDQSALINLYVIDNFVYVGLLVYGLSRLVDTAHQLEVVRAGLARAGGMVERLRLARDVHDLLGLGLSALALKSDLIEQLTARHDPQAAVEIQLMGRICATTRADIRQVTAGNQGSTLEEEVAVASDILSSAGIEVRATFPAQPLGATIDDVLVPVLRESVTNILRHSTATFCSIEIDTQVDSVRLAVGNNGVADQRHRAGWNGDQSDLVPGRAWGFATCAAEWRAPEGKCRRDN